MNDLKNFFGFLLLIDLPVELEDFHSIVDLMLNSHHLEERRINFTNVQTQNKPVGFS